VDRGYPALEPRNVQPAMDEVDLLPTEGAQLGTLAARAGRPAGSNPNWGSAGLERAQLELSVITEKD
jgi:hypothetical protein